MARNAVPKPVALLRVDDHAWESQLTNTVMLRFVGRIPAGWSPHEALQRLGTAAGSAVRELQGAVEDALPPRAGRMYAAKSKGASLFNTVCAEISVSRELERALQDRRSPEGWVALPAPWGGEVAVFTGGPDEQRAVRLVGLPPRVPMPFLQEILEANSIPVLELRALPCPALDMESCVAAHLVVPATAQLPKELQIRGSSGKKFATLGVQHISSLPRAPGEERAAPASYAAAAAGDGRSVRRAVPAATPAGDSGPAGGRRGGSASPGRRSPGGAQQQRQPSPAGAGGRRRQPSPAGAGGQRHQPSPTDAGQQLRQPSPAAAGQQLREPLPASAGLPRRKPSPTSAGGRQRQPSPSGSRRGRSRTRTPPRRPASGSPGCSLAPAGAAKKQIVTTAAGSLAAVPSTNPFAQLDGATNMDATPADVAAQLAAGPASNGGGSSGGS